MFCGKNNGFLDIFPWTNSVTVKGVPYLLQVPYHMVQHVLQHVSWSNHQFWCLHHTKSHYHNHNEEFWWYLPALLIVSQILFVESPFFVALHMFDRQLPRFVATVIPKNGGFSQGFATVHVGETEVSPWFPTVFPGFSHGFPEVSPWCSRAALVPTTAGATPWWPMRRRSQRPGRNWAATMGRSSMCPGGHDGPFFMGQDSWAWVLKTRLYDGHMII